MNTPGDQELIIVHRGWIIFRIRIVFNLDFVTNRVGRLLNRCQFRIPWKDGSKILVTHPGGQGTDINPLTIAGQTTLTACTVVLFLFFCEHSVNQSRGQITTALE